MQNLKTGCQADVRTQRVKKSETGLKLSIICGWDTG